jgi:SAM-dependent methyltransferase
VLITGGQVRLAEEFAERMLRTMNEAALALMVSVGHRTGLFDVMAGMPAATSAEIASRASLDERYVREWLAAMTTGRIIEHDSTAGSYSLPAGHAAWLTVMAGAFPRSRFTGFDFSEAGIAAARAEAGREGRVNVRFEQRDAARLGETARFDFITTFDAVHDQARPDLMLAGIAAALRPGGVYLCVDTSASSKLAENLGHPLATFLYTVSCMHCMTVSLADGGMGLGTMWGQQTARRMLGEAGFTSVEAKRIDGDIVNAYFIATK